MLRLPAPIPQDLAEVEAEVTRPPLGHLVEVIVIVVEEVEVRHEVAGVAAHGLTRRRKTVILNAVLSVITKASATDTDSMAIVVLAHARTRREIIFSKYPPPDNIEVIMR